MKNRIRSFRRQRGLTLKALAEAVGTTPQTISRLETEVMTVSTDWLERLAQALLVHPSDLIESPDRPDIPVIGQLGQAGHLAVESRDERLTLAVRADDPVAVHLTRLCGPYREGEYLIANRLTGDDRENALGRDALCCLADGRILLRRVIRGTAGTYTLVPLDAESDVRYNQELRWIAPVIVRLSYL